jgi:hypothetical protein
VAPTPTPSGTGPTATPSPTSTPTPTPNPTDTVVPIPTGDKFFIRVQTPTIYQAKADAYAYDPKSIWNPLTTSNPTKWNLWTLPTDASYYVTKDEESQTYGPYTSGAYNGVDFEKLEVVVRIQYIKLGYGITEAWVPVVKTETGDSRNLKFFGIDYWYFE